jgi:hypothetical protein
MVPDESMDIGPWDISPRYIEPREKFDLESSKKKSITKFSRLANFPVNQ